MDVKMNLQELLQTKMKTADLHDIAVKTGCKPQHIIKAKSRIKRVLIDPELGLSGRISEYKVSSEDFLRVLCQALGIEESIVNAELETLTAVIHKRKNPGETIIYLHGLDSIDANPAILTQLRMCCEREGIGLLTPTVDYTNLHSEIERLADLADKHEHEDYVITLMGLSYVTFMGFSLGGFLAEVLGQMHGINSIAINPIIKPTEFLSNRINSGCGDQLTQADCLQFKEYEEVVGKSTMTPRLVLLDEGDELQDAHITRQIYKNICLVIMFEGGSHQFEHAEESMQEVVRLVYCVCL